jgi:hypothetical protein
MNPPRHSSFYQEHLQATARYRPRGSRNALSEEVICALLRDFRQHGQKAVARVRRTQPAAYLKFWRCWSRASTAI